MNDDPKSPPRARASFAEDVLARDRRHVWHPFTQHGTESEPIVITGAKAASLFDADGNEILDLVSSWWTCTHGHSHPKLNAALAEQASLFEHVMFAGFTHQPAADLAQAVAKLLPGDLSRVFFSDDGSTSVEVALKIAYQYWINCGEPGRRMLVAFDGGYHGDTLGAMSLGRGSQMFSPFRDLMCKVAVLPYPATFEGRRRRGGAGGRRAVGLRGAARRPRTHDRRAHHRATAARGRRHAALPAELPQASRRDGARGGRPRHLRRGGDGLRADRNAVRHGAGGRRSRSGLPVQGAHRRLHADGRDGGAGSHVRGLCGGEFRARASARPFLHRQSAGLRRGARLAGPVRGGEDACADCAHQRAPSGDDGRACGAARRDPASPDRLDPRLRREGGGRLPIGRRAGVCATGISPTASISGRSGRRSISCRLTASPTRS